LRAGISQEIERTVFPFHPTWGNRQVEMLQCNKLGFKSDRAILLGARPNFSAALEPKAEYNRGRNTCNHIAQKQPTVYL
jgi:hypothetical protein